MIQSTQSASDALVSLAVDNGSSLTEKQTASGEGIVAGPSGGKVEFGFEVAADSEKAGSALLEGHLVVSDRGDGFRINAQHMARAIVVGDFLILDGDYLANDGTQGTFRVIASDQARRGRGIDTFAIRLSSGYSAGGVLDAGNIRIDTNEAETDR